MVLQVVEILLHHQIIVLRAAFLDPHIDKREAGGVGPICQGIHPWRVAKDGNPIGCLGMFAQIFGNWEVRRLIALLIQLGQRLALHDDIGVGIIEPRHHAQYE